VFAERIRRRSNHVRGDASEVRASYPGVQPSAFDLGQVGREDLVECPI